MLTFRYRFSIAVLYGGGNGRLSDRLAVHWHRDAGNGMIGTPEFLYAGRSADCDGLKGSDVIVNENLILGWGG